MITKYRNYLLGIIGILLTISIFLGVKYLMLPKNKEIPEVKLREIIDSKAFAIMVQKGNTYEEYTSEDNTWPGADYIYKEAKCVDNKGALVNDAVTFEDGKAALTTDKTVFCTLYFDEKPKSTLDILREKDKEVSGIEHLSEQGEMYRYQGTDDVPNWILFGTKENCEKDEEDKCTNSKLNNMTYDEYVDKYMYRIIGITEEGQMYLIKETFLKEGSGTSFTWNDKYYTSETYTLACDDKICPEWNTSLLFKRINGTSNGTTQGTGTISNNANTDIFVDSTQYDYLKSGDENGTNDGIGSDWYNLIADHNWMYGDTITGSTAAATFTGDTVYAIETGKEDTKHYVGIDGNNEEQTYKWLAENKVKAKISLMYIHDYVYSYYDGSTEKSRGNPKNYSTAKTGWLFFQKDGYNTTPNREWLSTRWGVHSTESTFVDARSVSDGGYVFSLSLNTGGGVRPVFYLSSEAEIADGDGTKETPFILA